MCNIRPADVVRRRRARPSGPPRRQFVHGAAVRQRGLHGVDVGGRVVPVISQSGRCQFGGQRVLATPTIRPSTRKKLASVSSPTPACSPYAWTARRHLRSIIRARRHASPSETRCAGSGFQTCAADSTGPSGSAGNLACRQGTLQPRRRRGSRPLSASTANVLLSASSPALR